MKRFITILTMIATSATLAQNTSPDAGDAEGKAKTVKSTFSRETRVHIEIKADAAIVWALLTKASDYPRWNSTVISIEGNIALGEKIKLKSTLDPKRTFKLKVKTFEPEKKLVWGDGQGNRVYTITKNASANGNAAQGNGAVTFSMTEKIGGLMFPMYAKMIPPFDQSFERFASDLKRASETMMNAR